MVTLVEAISKEAEEFMIRLGGGFLSALEDIAVEGYFVFHQELWGKFPYMEVIPGSPVHWDDLIVAGLSAAPWVLGLLAEDDAKKKGDAKAMELGKTVRELGEGGLTYSLPMIVHRGAIGQLLKIRGVEARSSQPKHETQSPVGIVYQL